MKASVYKFSQKVLGEAGVRLAATAFLLILARRVGAEEFGKYSTAMAYSALCLIGVDMGMNAILTREIARHPEQRPHLASVSHGMKLLAGLLSWVLLVTLTFVFHLTAEMKWITACMGIVVIGQTLTDYFNALLSGIEAFGLEALQKATVRLISVLPGFVTLLLGYTLQNIMVALVAGAVMGYGIALLIVRRHFTDFRLSLDPRVAKPLLKKSLPLLLAALFWILYESQDILILNAYRISQDEVGLFAAAIKLIDVLRVYPVLVIGVFFPSLARLHHEDPNAFRKKQGKLWLFLSGTLLGIGGLLYAGAPVAIPLLYKEQYLPAVPLLQALAPALVLSGLNYLQMQILIAQNKERMLVWSSLLASLSNFAIAAYFVPHARAMGTCYALFGSECCYFIFLWLASREQIPHR